MISRVEGFRDRLLDPTSVGSSLGGKVGVYDKFVAKFSNEDG